jgi:hypothetical protein
LTRFGVGFWKDALRERGYAVVEERFDLDTLVKQRVIPSSHLAKGRGSPYLMDAILLYNRLLSRLTSSPEETAKHHLRHPT